MGSGLFQDTVLYEIVAVLRIDGVAGNLVIVLAVFHRHKRLITDFVGVHHKGISRVERIQLERGLVFFAPCVRQNQSERRSANHLPLHNLLVLGRFVLREHQLVQASNRRRNGFLAALADILNGFSTQIPNLKGHDFVCAVFYNAVADFRANFFRAVQNGLLSLVILPQIVNLRTVQSVNGQCLEQHFHNITVGDFRNATLNDSAPKHRACLCDRLRSVDYISHICPSSLKK